MKKESKYIVLGKTAYFAGVPILAGALVLNTVHDIGMGIEKANNEDYIRLYNQEIGRLDAAEKVGVTTEAREVTTVYDGISKTETKAFTTKELKADQLGLIEYAKQPQDNSYGAVATGFGAVATVFVLLQVIKHPAKEFISNGAHILANGERRLGNFVKNALNFSKKKKDVAPENVVNAAPQDTPSAS